MVIIQRLTRSAKAMAFPVVLALLWLPGGLACALGCASAAPAQLAGRAECHHSTPASPPFTTEILNASSAEHNCCHISSGPRQGSEGSFNPLHPAAALPCGLHEGRSFIPAVSQRVTTDGASAIIVDKKSGPVLLDFRDPRFLSLSRLPDRGGTYLRFRVLLI